MTMLYIAKRSISWSCVREAKNLTKKLRKKQIIEDTVFQYAGKDPKRADRVYGWGWASTGALGEKTFVKPLKHQIERVTQLVPHKLRFFDEQSLKVQQAAAGYGFSLFACKEKDNKRSTLFGSGVNTDSQLGYHEYPHNSGRILGVIIQPSSIALPYENRDTAKILKLAAGRAHSVIVTSEAVFSLGNNAYGQCGRTIVEGEIYHGSQIINRLAVSPLEIEKVVCGQDSTFIVLKDGQVLACGLNSDGQAGQGHYKAVEELTPVKGDIEGEKIVDLSCKGDCVLAVSEKGDLFGWGNSEYSQLEAVAGDQSQVNISHHLPFPAVGKVVKVASAGSMCAVLNAKSDVFVWGYGVLGKGPKFDSTKEPSQLPSTLFGKNEFFPDHKVVNIYAGLSHFMALTNIGDVYAWGKNKTAVLGFANNLHQYFPYKVSVPAEVKEIICGVDHTLALSKAYI